MHTFSLIITKDSKFAFISRILIAIILVIATILIFFANDLFNFNNNLKLYNIVHYSAIFITVIAMFAWFYFNFNKFLLKGTLSIDGFVLNIAPFGQKEVTISLLKVEDVILRYESYRKWYMLKSGGRNYLSFKHNGKVFSFEFLIKNKKENDNLIEILTYFYKNKLVFREIASNDELLLLTESGLSYYELKQKQIEIEKQ